MGQRSARRHRERRCRCLPPPVVRRSLAKGEAQRRRRSVFPAVRLGASSRSVEGKGEGDKALTLSTGMGRRRKGRGGMIKREKERNVMIVGNVLSTVTQSDTPERAAAPSVSVIKSSMQQ